MRPRSGSVGIAVLLGVAASVSACYESSVPLSPPGKVAADAGLFGRWHCVPDPEKKEDQDQATLTILAFDRAQYYAEWNEDGKVTRYRAYGSRVGARVLLNVLELPDAGGPDRA